MRLIINIIAGIFRWFGIVIDEITNHEARELERDMAYIKKVESHPEIYNWKRVVCMFAISIICIILTGIIIF